MGNKILLTLVNFIRKMRLGEILPSPHLDLTTTHLLHPSPTTPPTGLALPHW